MPQLNVLGDAIAACSEQPKTGFFRDGCCHTDERDVGMHTICVKLTAEFLAFSKSQGNDLSTPRPEFNFPGLKPGNQWCLCATRWLEAWQAGCAPEVLLRSTHERSLEVVSLEQLWSLAADREDIAKH